MRRSNASSSAMPAPRPMKIWRWTGSVGLTLSPSPEGSTGTSRQPRKSWPSSAMTFSMIRFDDFAAFGIARQEQGADRIMAGRRQRETEPCRLFLEETMRDLDEHAAAVAGLRIGTDRAAVIEIEQNFEALLDERMRFAVLHVGNEADAAGIVLAPRIVKALRRVHRRISNRAHRPLPLGDGGARHPFRLRLCLAAFVPFTSDRGWRRRRRHRARSAGFQGTDASTANGQQSCPN